MKSWKKHPQKYLRKTEIDFFFLLPWACSKMWLIDQLYIKLGFLHREYQFSIFIRQIHFFVSKLLILRRWNERFLEFHQFHSGDLYSHLIFSAMIKMKYLSNRCLMVSTNQADPGCFYFRMSWILMERSWFYKINIALHSTPQVCSC